MLVKKSLHVTRSNLQQLSKHANKTTKLNKHNADVKL